MLNYFDDRNKEEESLLDEELTMAVDSRVSNTFQYFWRITRHRTKEYMYVGMDRATAKACVAAKRAQYTHTFFNWVFKDDKWVRGSRYTACCATITSQKLTGNMWNVRISVDETCIAYRSGDASGSQIDPAEVIDEEYGTGWSYDE